ncbi:hypothetical protein QSH57_010203 [Fusarium oxysporum f. sp. vasinfectum]|nr:hypothetical protein QSH57_010203 [Fusarium oxysporum f. sp. vasinfectum]
MFFQIWHPNWPVFHRPTFNSTLKPPTLIAALSLIGATLGPERKQRDQAMVWLETVENWIFQGPGFNEDIVPQTDDDNQAYQVLQRLDIVEAAYAIVLLMNWEGNTKTRLRARRTRFPDIVYIARSLYPFTMPGTSEEEPLAPCSLYDHWRAFALREELIRTLLYTFPLVSAFVMFYNMSPRMVINELEFGLAATDEHFGASDAEAWFMSTQAAENRAVACSQVTLSQSISMIMTEDCGATQWGIFEQMSPLNLFAIASGKLYGKTKQQVWVKYTV